MVRLRKFLWALAILAGSGLTPASLRAAGQGDFNADTLVDSADLVGVAGMVASPPSSSRLRIDLDFDRNGFLDNNDTRYLAGVILGRMGFLPAVRLAVSADGPGIFTRDTHYSLPVSVEDTGTTFTLSINGVVAVAGEGTGFHTIDFGPLVEGVNIFDLTYLDGLGRVVSRPVEIYRDTIAPTIVIDAPAENELVRAYKVPVTGQAVDGATGAAVLVNGYEMKMEPDGRFSGEVTFTGNGGARLTAVAIDGAGNRASAARNIEIFVSAPDEKQLGAARLDLPEGALRTRGESASVDVITNAEVKGLLGPGSDLIVTQMPMSGFTDGVIILPSGMMISVESGEVPEAGLSGAESPPLFNNKPAISLQNEGGATNATPLWIFQIIPDVDGDGKPELSLASRARVETEGPLAGRIVPIQGEAGFPGVFDPGATGFEGGTLGQVQGLGAVKRLLERQTKRFKATGIEPTSRVTFYCCAASAVTPVTGRVKCDPTKIDSVYTRLGTIEVDLAVLRTRIQNRTDRIVAAANTGEKAQSDLIGFTSIPGTKTKIPTIVNGKVFKCLKKFIPGGAATDVLAEALNKVKDVRSILGDDSRPVQEQMIRIIDIYSKSLERDLVGLGWNTLSEESGRIQDKLTKLKEFNKFFKSAKMLYDCTGMVGALNDFIRSYRTITREDPLADQDFAAYDATIKEYKRLEDCRRQWVAGVDLHPFAPGTGRRKWITLKSDPLVIGQQLDSMQQYVLDATSHTDQLAEHYSIAGELLSDPAITRQQAIDLLTAYEAKLAGEIALQNRNADLMTGFDAIVEGAAISSPISARIVTDGGDVEQSYTEAIAAKGAFPGSAVTLQGGGSPFGTVAAADGSFTHFVFTQLTIEGTPPDKVAILEDREYDADASALGGMLGGRKSGNSGRLVFPFTPFSTVDFNAVVDVGDVLIRPTLADTAGVPPVVDILKPLSGLAVPAGFPLRVEVNTTDDVGVLGVEVYVGGEPSLSLERGLAKGVVNVGSTLGPLQIKVRAVDPGGNVGEDTVTINVVDGTGAFVLTPPTARLTTVRTQQFTASYRGAPAVGVVWRVNNFAGGNAATVGTVSASGLYDGSLADTGSLAAFTVTVSAELADFPGYRAKAKVLILDSGDVVAPTIAFSYPAPSRPGGLLPSRPIAFSIPAPSFAGGVLPSRPFAFSFPSPAAPGGTVPSRPFAFRKEP